MHSSWLEIPKSVAPRVKLTSSTSNSYTYSERRQVSDLHGSHKKKWLFMDRVTVRSGKGDPPHSVKVENLLNPTRPDPTRPDLTGPVRFRKPPDPTRLAPRDIGNLLTRPVGRVMTRENPLEIGAPFETAKAWLSPPPPITKSSTTAHKLLKVTNTLPLEFLIIVTAVLSSFINRS